MSAENKALGGAPTGERVKVHGDHRISGNQIAGSLNVWDTLGMSQQLGAVPPLGQARDRVQGKRLRGIRDSHWSGVRPGEAPDGDPLAARPHR
jgi:hypothetical protein